MKRLAKYIAPIIIFITLSPVCIALLGNLGIILVQVGIAVVFVYYIFLENKNRSYLLPFAISIAVLPILEIYFLLEFESINITVVNVLTYVFSSLTIFYYLLRFVAKPNKFQFFEILKLVGVVQLAIAYSIDHELTQTSIFFLALIYFVIKLTETNYSNEIMKGIIAGGLVFVSIFFTVFAQIQSAEAEKQKMAAIRMAEEAQNNLKKNELLFSERIENLENRIDSLQLQLTNCQKSE